MSSGREIKQKILGVKKTKKITKAMEMVAASKMKKAQERMLRSRPYAEQIAKVIAQVVQGNLEYSHPFLKKRPLKNVALVLISSDRGLCGGLNTQVFKKALEIFKDFENQGVSVHICSIGAKAEGFFKRIGGKVISQISHLGENPSVNDLIGTLKIVLDLYLNEKIDSFMMISNQFINTMRQVPSVKTLLPIVPDDSLKNNWDYLYEPDDAKKILDKLLARYIESLVYQGLVENIASEQASRMVAMKNATDNAGQVIQDLQLAYNKARQASITRELSEIVAGAAAV